jgi:tRNA(Arg) A34 adenosine deaminase TadA
LKSHKYYIEYVIHLAEEKMQQKHGGPFAAVVVKNSEIIGIGYNSVTSTNDPTNHAEVVAIRNACKKLKTYDLSSCVIYTNCEPCPMCLGAIYWARLDAIYYASTREDAKVAGFDDEFIYDEFSRSVETRKIPLTRIIHPGHKRPFEKWIEMEDKTMY